MLAVTGLATATGRKARAQAQQFSYNCDFIGYVPLPRSSSNSDRGLLFVNHEYTNEELMFPDLGRQDKKDFVGMTRELVELEMAAPGGSVKEVAVRARLTPIIWLHGQADFLTETRRAADLLGATPVDHPEDVEPNPATGRVYVMLTNNSIRKSDDTDTTNPCGPDPHGHIVELMPPGSDHRALVYRREVFVQRDDPNDPGADTGWSPATTANG